MNTSERPTGCGCTHAEDDDGGRTCGCGSGGTEELPTNPFLALRVAYGMLLGEEDLRVLMGQPRGKQMLHSAWLHGSGVVWGYPVRAKGLWEVTVGPGLAIDGWGRELIHETTCQLDLRGLISADRDCTDQDHPGHDHPGPDHGKRDHGKHDHQKGDHGRRDEADHEGDDPNCRTWTVSACLVAEFDTCLTAPVPILSDPCDVTRQHDDYSRVVERARISVRPGRCPSRDPGYPRVRMLFGVAPIDPRTDAGADAAAAQDSVESSAQPAVELSRQLRLMACRDSAELRPAEEEGECYPGFFPVGADDTAVVLARLCLTVRERDGCPEILDLDVDPCVRTTLLPTATITELLAGQGSGGIDPAGGGDAGGPRVIGPRIELRNGGRRLLIPVTAPLDRATVSRGVQVTSFSPGGSGAGWVIEDVDDAAYRESGELRAIVVELAADQPIHDRIRVIVRGTGPRPVMGRAWTGPDGKDHDAVPLAGLTGGPPGSRHDGHDAVWILSLPEHDGTAKPKEPEDEADSEDDRSGWPEPTGTEADQ